MLGQVYFIIWGHFVVIVNAGNILLSCHYAEEILCKTIRYLKTLKWFTWKFIYPCILSFYIYINFYFSILELWNPCMRHLDKFNVNRFPKRKTFRINLDLFSFRAILFCMLKYIFLDFLNSFFVVYFDLQFWYRASD